MFWNRFSSSLVFFYFEIFSSWDMVDFVLNIYSELAWDLNELKNIYMLGGF